MALSLHTAVTGQQHTWSVFAGVRVEERCPPMLIERGECPELSCVEHDLCVDVDHVFVCSDGRDCE